MKKLNNLSLPAVILIASIILGGFIFATQVIKQRSIERQQDRNYVAERKDNCYDIFFKEREKWNNVKGFRYSESRDVCIINYTRKEYSREECIKHGETYSVLSDRCEIPFTKEF